MIGSAEDLRGSFQQAMREHPHDPGTRLIYADYLDDNGHYDEAVHHRIIGAGLQRGSEPYRLYAEGEASGYPPTPFSARPGRGGIATHPLYIDRIKNGRLVRKMATPIQASSAAYRAGIATLSLMDLASSASAGYARAASENAVREARAAQLPTYEGHHRGAALSHEIAAEYYMGAASDMAERPHTIGRSAYYRRAALAHLYAAHVHRRALGEV